MTNSVTQPTVTRPVEGRSGVTASEPAYECTSRSGPASKQLSLSVSVCINTWRSRFLLDSLCCLSDSWRIAGKNLKFIHTALNVFLTAWLLDLTLSILAPFMLIGC